MIIRIGLLQKKSGMSHQEFRERWLGHHADIAARLPGLVHYEQNHVIDHEQRGIDFRRGPEQLDGFSMLWFRDEKSMKAAISSEAGRMLVEDEAMIFDSVRILVVDQLEVIPPDTNHPLIKRMSTLRRLDNVTAENFRHEWRVEHAHLVKRLAGVRGYRQNLVIGRESPKGVLVDREALPIDGIVELWFDSKGSLDSAFSSPPGGTLMAHAREFISEITTFLVERHVVVKKNSDS